MITFIMTSLLHIHNPNPVTTTILPCNPAPFCRGWAPVVSLSVGGHPSSSCCGGHPTKSKSSVILFLFILGLSWGNLISVAGTPHPFSRGGHQLSVCPSAGTPPPRGVEGTRPSPSLQSFCCCSSWGCLGPTFSLSLAPHTLFAWICVFVVAAASLACFDSLVVTSALLQR